MKPVLVFCLIAALIGYIFYTMDFMFDPARDVETGINWAMVTFFVGIFAIFVIKIVNEPPNKH